MACSGQETETPARLWGPFCWGSQSWTSHDRKCVRTPCDPKEERQPSIFVFVLFLCDFVLKRTKVTRRQRRLSAIPWTQLCNGMPLPRTSVTINNHLPTRNNPRCSSNKLRFHRLKCSNHSNTRWFSSTRWRRTTCLLRSPSPKAWLTREVKPPCRLKTGLFRVSPASLQQSMCSNDNVLHICVPALQHTARAPTWSIIQEDLPVMEVVDIWLFLENSTKIGRRHECSNLWIVRSFPFAETLARSAVYYSALVYVWPLHPRQTIPRPGFHTACIWCATCCSYSSMWNLSFGPESTTGISEWELPLNLMFWNEHRAALFLW